VGVVLRSCCPWPHLCVLQLLVAASLLRGMIATTPQRVWLVS
jgi:hypothetical protein